MFTDVANNLNITSNENASTVEEGTEVTFTCTVEANPHPSLYLMYSDVDGTQPISEQTVTDSMLSVTVTLTRYHSMGRFFCRAVGENPTYILDSQDKISYSVYCKFHAVAFLRLVLKYFTL